MCLGSKQPSLFSFYALPSGGKLKGAVVHSLVHFTNCKVLCILPFIFATPENTHFVRGSFTVSTYLL